MCSTSRVKSEHPHSDQHADDSREGVHGEAVTKAEKLRVFISYSRDDLAFADQLDAALGLHNFSVVLDRHGICGGEDWKRRLSSLIWDATQ